ncbi:MAG TPA: hypothetical protein VE553_05145 [Candidatus Binatia bacterium]|jgi:hypothetical protein|nr:hypothetical protein [Candidatus Binatia bacterium]
MNNNHNAHGLGNLDDLFQSAQDDGLTADTMDLVVSNLNGPTMMSAVGVPLDLLSGNEVTLAMNIVDMSGSMQPFADDLISAYNDDYLAAMALSSSADDILVSTIFFEDQVQLFHGYLNLQDVPRLSRRIYRPGATTALYDAVAAGLTNMVLYAQQLRQCGVIVRCLALVYSDGEDNASRQPAPAVRRAVEELLKHEIYTLAYVGFRNGGLSEQALRQMADTIAFPEILTSGMGRTELQRTFRMASMSTINVSQGHPASSGVFS